MPVKVVAIKRLLFMVHYSKRSHARDNLNPPVTFSQSDYALDLWTLSATRPFALDKIAHDPISQSASDGVVWDRLFAVGLCTLFAVNPLRGM